MCVPKGPESPKSLLCTSCLSIAAHVSIFTPSLAWSRTLRETHSESWVMRKIVTLLRWGWNTHRLTVPQGSRHATILCLRQWSSAACGVQSSACWDGIETPVSLRRGKDGSDHDLLQHARAWYIPGRGEIEEVHDMWHLYFRPLLWWDINWSTHRMCPSGGKRGS